MNIFSFLCIVNGFFNFWLGLSVFLSNRKRLLNAYFFLFTISITAWNMGYSLMYSTHDLLQALEFAKFGSVGIIFIPLMGNLFVLQLLHKQEKVLNIILFLFSLLLLVLLYSNGFYSGVTHRFWGNYPAANILNSLNILFFVSIFYKIVFQLWKGAKKVIGVEKIKIYYVLLAFGIGSFGFIDWIPNYYENFYPLAFILSSSWVFLIAYAITKARLMDISVVISKSLAYVITVLILGGGYLGLVFSYRSFISTSIDTGFLAVTIVYGILVGEIFQRTRLHIQTTADKLILRGRYDYYAELSNASMQVTGELSLKHILKVLYDTFYNVVEISNPRIFLLENFADPNKEAQNYLVWSKADFEPDFGGEKISVKDPLVVKLVQEKQPLREDSRLLIPCLVEDRLVAVMVLGKKLSEDPYTPEDLKLLTALAAQSAIALDHTRTYEQVRKELADKEIQLERAQIQAERAQRLDSVSILAKGVEHEVRNPLTIIRSRLSRMENKLEDKVFIQETIDLSLKHIDRVHDIIKRLRDVTKTETAQKAEMNLNELIAEVIRFLPHINKIEIRQALGDLPQILGDRNLLTEVFLNLFQNAIEAMAKSGGILEVKTSAYAHQEKNYLKIEISDTGAGITQENLAKIFDPFFSTKDMGTGLGLSTVHKIIVEDHHGKIDVKSSLGRGTAFTIVLPASPS